MSETQTEASKIQKLQFMFMSMGEPMLNRAGLEPALRELHRMYPNAALLISTSAPRVDYSWLIALSKEIPAIGLQFSVHESTDEQRDKLIPLKGKLTLAEMAKVGNDWAAATGRTPFFNYCAQAHNTSEEDVQRLLYLFNPVIWQATVSVVCERDEGVAAANERQRSLASAFAQKLLVCGYSVRIFNPAGQDDIGGGCGQLWFVQNWMREHPNLARPSVGRALDRVHAPSI
jgi:23S rRNA (adenine2503-C2)-methyltransferase